MKKGIETVVNFGDLIMYMQRKSSLHRVLLKCLKGEGLMKQVFSYNRKITCAIYTEHLKCLISKRFIKRFKKTVGFLTCLSYVPEIYSHLTENAASK